MQPNQIPNPETPQEPVEKPQPNQPELNGNNSTEKLSPAAEKAPSVSSGAPTSVPTQTTPTSQQPPPQSTSSTTSQQLPADIDEDLIEKPWVEKAEKIIKDDQEDPHKLGDDENDLNKDYLKTRFGY